jgi:hypothetical protein
MKKSFFAVFILLHLLPSITETRIYAQGIFINEFMVSNSSSIQDPDFNAYSDWIEIYNSGATPVNLLNHYISDDLSNPGKFKFTTDIFIDAGSYALIWADDMNTGSHTNFKLSKTGETIILSSPSGVIIDSVYCNDGQTDISKGRYPDGNSNWYSFYPPTPGSKNLQSNIYNKITQPIVSLTGGFYQSSINLILSHPDSSVIIHYTIDGKSPTINSQTYTVPIEIDTTIVLTAKAFKEGFIPSSDVINTYFINFSCELPVFSLSTDPANFFSDTAGIYVEGTNGITGYCSNSPRNWNQDWERPVNIEFYENEELAFNLPAGVKIYGGCTRLYPMKSLAIYFREIYGCDKLNYRLFSDQQITEYNNFILRSSGQDWWRTMFRDGMVQTLIEQGMKLDYQDYRPSIVFINGQYYGIHNIREKLNEHYIGSHHNVDKNNIDLIDLSKSLSAVHGDLIAYNAMINFLSTRNMALQSNYDYIKSIVDIDEYIDYQIAEIYGANGDWPGSNMKLWRERKPGSKWRWMIYDLDFTFGGNAQGLYNTNTLAQATATNGPSWPNPPWATLMLRKMLDNNEFKNEFIQRFAVHMNTTFNAEHVINLIDSMSSVIASEIPRHKTRWPKSISLGNDWLVNIQVMKDFVELRAAEVRNHIYSKFNLNGSYSLIIKRNNPRWGKIFTHSVEVKEDSSQNIFFKNIPLKVKAVAMPGYRFVKWEGISDLTVPETEIIASSDSWLTAVFEPDDLNITSIVINEINYNSSSSFDTEDWFELYNPLPLDINISGWKVTDSNFNNFTFPDGTIIKGEDYLIVCRDTSKFNSLYLNFKKNVGNINFGLNSLEDVIILSDQAESVIDSVFYSSSNGWPSQPNGNGPTLSLINPQYDNSLSGNWKPSGGFGTPGSLNDTYTKAEENKEQKPDEFLLSYNYPNPFNNSTVISFALPEREFVSLKIYDILGREILTLLEEEKEAGYYNIPLTLNAVSGVYIYVLQTKERIQSRKMILLK